MTINHKLDQPSITSQPATAPTNAKSSDLDGSNFTVHVMKEVDIEECIEFFSIAFSVNEPSTSELGWTLDDWTAFWKFYIPVLALEGNSHLVRDNETGKVVCGFTAMDFASPAPGGFEKFLEGERGHIRLPFLEILSCLEHQFIDHMKLDCAAKEDPSILPRGKIFHLFGLATHAEYRNRGLGKKVTLATIEHARRQGYQCAMVELSSQWSQKVFAPISKKLFGLDCATWASSDGKKHFTQVPEKFNVDELTLAIIEF
eukprot:GHVN01016681.1.p1 GENE.GHVN01016681.1~~GHVN01016681.1.p1  ORF type:complete len:258 (+),score=30.74 GHVN01016681.1:193-966(+)